MSDPIYTPLDSGPHRLHGWQRTSNFHFAQRDVCAPVLLAELGHALPTYPLAFKSLPQGGFQLVVLLSLREGENLFVDAAGKWLASYIPSHYRAYPFTILQARNEDKTLYMLGFDHASDLYREAPSGQNNEQRFFTDEGEPQPQLQQITLFLTECAKNRFATQRAVAAVDAAHLLEPWHFATDQAEETSAASSGFYRINTAALKQLPGKVLELLRDVQALDLAYAQIFSVPRLKNLHQLSAQRKTLAKPETNPVKPTQFSEEEMGDLLRFDWMK